jgi:carboxyl-terminal processing protease
LTGNRDGDWQIFSQAYTALINGLPRLATVQEALAQVALQEMASALKDDHTAYLPSDAMRPAIAQLSDSGDVPSFGVVTSPITPTAPLFITDVFQGSPAAKAGLKPGDTITAIGGQALFSGGQANAGLFHFALPQIGTPVTLTVLRPASGAILTVTLSPRNLVPPDTRVRLLAGTIAYVRLYGFTKHAANEVLDGIKGLGPAVRGVVLDLRGNEGGYADQAVRLLSSFIHHKVVAVSVDGNGKRDPQRTDDRVALLHLPLAVLIDQGSASSSEIVAGSVRDFGIGRLFGERTGGALAGAEFFALGDGSGLEITEAYVLGPESERIDGIGVPPDDHVATTAVELSAGHDPAVDQAVRYLRAQAGANG